MVEREEIKYGGYFHEIIKLKEIIPNK